MVEVTAPSAESNDTRDRPSWQTVATFSRGVAVIPNLAALVGAERVILRPSADVASTIDAVIGWGEKPNTRVARDYARRHGIAYWRAEDGFLRSVGLGVNGDPPLSVVLDDRGVYYDARRESLLEALLNRASGGDPLDDEGLLARARRAIASIVASRLSKYNHTPSGPVDLGGAEPERVLVVDQTFADLSVSCGLASAASFTAMLEAALAEHPDAEIIVKTHPDVVAGKKRGYLGEPASNPRVRLLGESINPLALIEAVDHVYVVTSQLGFEALLLGKSVSCFGVPFYAGWGLTDDRCRIARRSRSRSLEQLFAAAYILYARYIDPDSGEPCEIERVNEHLALQRAQIERNHGAIFCFGFQFWKRKYVRAYLRSPGNRVVFPLNAAHAARLGFDSRARMLVWGYRAGSACARLAGRHGVGISRMEDGFLRSVGLGSDLALPASLVVDSEGIYYNPKQPSELESILQNTQFSAEELERARLLRHSIVGAGLSKYNVGGSLELSVPAGRRVLLVPGQVEDDASIRLGCRDIRTNAALLREARRANPDAFIIYKPHPDVLSGNRKGHIASSAALSMCDHVEQDASLAQCLAVVDEVHTLTSLVGFEALLRDLTVVVYGQPFYSGWGLTVDRHPISRRRRHLTVDELVAGALIRYPRYFNHRTRSFTVPETIVSQLCTQRDSDKSARTVKMSWPRRQLRKLVHAYKGAIYAP